MVAKSVPPSPSALNGNAFEFFVPKPPPKSKHDSPASPGEVETEQSSMPKPAPVSAVPAKGGKSKYLKPAKFIKSHFIPTKHANFGSKGNLGGAKHVIRDLQVTRAALECGYGPRSKWSASLALKPHEATGLARYLIARIEMVVSCIEVNSKNARLPRTFYKRVEPSEKVAMSFILGGIGTYLAARLWLTAGGQSVDAFLHAGIYSKAVNGAEPEVTFSPSSGKWPDYVVATKSGHWHVFESKAGTRVNRWARVVEGLVQLSNLPVIGWTGSTLTPAVSCVCVHTSVDSDQALHVTAVDPPGEVDDGENPKKLELIPGVCKLLLLIETLDQYRALADNLILQEDAAPREWSMATSSRFGGLRIGVLIDYLRRESEVRWRLAVYLAVREVLEDESFGDLQQPEAHRRLAQRVKLRLSDRDKQGQAMTGRRVLWIDTVLVRIARDLGTADFLHRCSKHLKLEAIARHLIRDSEQAALTLTQGTQQLFTSGGMYLAQLAPMSPEANTEGKR
ncbi:hypothetical protein [Ramlibacter sp. WS9]|uniref:hypothetical protein n=1 Tax=Ramlibacter sp. WS9 TaxID=1882741 RepID=UPI0011411378|nr:hypothetical protein [Ramlibacter sp. WS9]